MEPKFADHSTSATTICSEADFGKIRQQACAPVILNLVSFFLFSHPRGPQHKVAQASSLPACTFRAALFIAYSQPTITEWRSHTPVTMDALPRLQQNP
jgi:hypothetical protein